MAPRSALPLALCAASLLMAQTPAADDPVVVSTDHPRLLQSYIWQDYDLAPHFPTLIKFLKFWTQKLEGPLHSVRVGHSKLIRPAEIRAIGGEFRLN